MKKKTLLNKRGEPIYKGFGYRDKSADADVFCLGRAPEEMGGGGTTYVEVKYKEGDGSYYADIDHLTPNGQQMGSAVDFTELPDTLREHMDMIKRMQGPGFAAALMTWEKNDDALPAFKEWINAFYMGAACFSLIIHKSAACQDPKIMHAAMEEIGQIKDGGGKLPVSDQDIARWAMDALTELNRRLADHLANGGSDA